MNVGKAREVFRFWTLVTMLFLAFLVRMSAPLTEDQSQPTTVSFHVIAHSRFSDDYANVVNTAIASARRRLKFSPLFRSYDPKGRYIQLEKDNPKTILHAFCDHIFNETSTTVLHIFNPFGHLRDWRAAIFLSKLFRDAGLPVISWGPEYATVSGKGAEKTHQFQISPTLHHQVQAMLHVLDEFGWTHFSVVYTAHIGHQQFLNAVRMLIQERVKLLKESELRKSTSSVNRYVLLTEVEITDPNSEETIRRDLGSLLRTDSRIILFFTSERSTHLILDVAGRMGLLVSEYVWILAFEAIPKGMDGLALNLPVGLLGVWYDSDENEMRKVVNDSANIWLRALLASQKASLTSQGQRPWHAPSFRCQRHQELYWRDGRVFYQYLINASDEQNLSAHIWSAEVSIVNVQPDQMKGTRRWVEVGKWTAERGLDMQRIRWMEDTRVPPSGKPGRTRLRVVTRPEEPYVTYRNVTNNNTCESNMLTCRVHERNKDGDRLSNLTIIKCCTGLSIDLLLRISQSLSFDVDIYEVEDYQWGKQDSTGQWDGLIKDLIDRRADMAVTSLRITEDRSRAVNFSVPFLETGITIIVSIRDGAISATAFLEPYDYPSWCFILVFSVHSVGTSIFLFEWFSPFGLDRGRKHPTEHRFSLLRTFWLIWAMLFGASVSTDTPRGVSSKFLANIWALFAVVFLASYTANLAAFMITKEEYYNLSGIQDWRLQNPQWMKPAFKYGTIPNTSTEDNIRKNNRYMFLYMQKYKQNSIEEALNALKKQQLHAFIYDSTVLEYRAGKDEDCRLITVGKWYAMSGYGLAFPEGSPWTTRVNSVILDMQQKGEMERLQEFWLSGACHTKRKKSENNGISKGVSTSTLGILNFTSAFILLGAGTALAFLTFVLEHCVFCLSSRRLGPWKGKGCTAFLSLSMGMSLTFQQSVHNALRLQRSYRCSNPLCRSQLCKVNQRLDRARLRLAFLQREISALAVERESEQRVWQFEPETVTSAYSSRSAETSNMCVCQFTREGINPKVTVI